MRYEVNLSSKPFQNRTLFWLGMVVGFGLVLAVGLWVTNLSAAAAVEAQRLDDKIDNQTREIEDLTKRQPKYEPIEITQPDFEALREAQELIGRKALSWTQLLSQLERIMPKNVRVVSVSVLRGADDNKGERRGPNSPPVDWLNRKVPLTLEVATKDDRKITGELLTTLNKQSNTYNAFVMEQLPQPETGETLFKISIDYTPPFSAPSRPTAVAQGGGK